MTLGERIRGCRKHAGMTQERVAGMLGISRQAVAKWEKNQSAPNTENLFRLAELFGTTVDLLLYDDEAPGHSTAEQVHRVSRRDEERKAHERRAQRKSNLLAAGLVAGAYLCIYLLGRIIWCRSADTSILGVLALATPTGAGSYLYGWLLSSRLFWLSMAVSAVPALCGKHRFAFATLAAFTVGLAAGMLFGPNPAGAAFGHGHYGWAIWGGLFLLSIPAGILLERFLKGNLLRISVKPGLQDAQRKR